MNFDLRKIQEERAFLSVSAGVISEMHTNAGRGYLHLANDEAHRAAKPGCRQGCTQAGYVSQVKVCDRFATPKLELVHGANLATASRVKVYPSRW